MIRLADEVFAVRTDPSQLNVDQNVLNRLKKIHPACVTEYAVEDGPVAWILIIPVSLENMHRFLKKEISEKELFQLTHPGGEYQAIYLCSALVLPEFRKKGIAKKLTLDAIAAIREIHPVKALFYWPFSSEGALLARSVATSTGLDLFCRNS